MALIECSFVSKSLKEQTSISVVIPVEKNCEEISQNKFYVSEAGMKYPTLYLLHGATGYHNEWIRNTGIERYAMERKLAVVMPYAATSFYADMVKGLMYWTYVSEELPQVARALFPLSDKREDNFVAGASMGGYGAFKLAMRKPEDFAVAASISGALDLASQMKVSPYSQLKAMITDAYGDIEMFEDSENDLLHLLEKLDQSAVDKPKFYQACGTEDFLYSDNIKFRDSAAKTRLDLTYEEGPGRHEMDFVDAYLKKVLDWLPLKKNDLR